MTNLSNALANVPMAATLNPARGMSIADVVALGVPEQFVRKALRDGSKMVDVQAAWARSNQNPANRQPVTANGNPPVSINAAKSELERLRAENAAMRSAEPVSPLQAEIDRLMAENAALRAKKATTTKLGVKASEKGAVSVYGLGRFPVTLYAEQWDRLINQIGIVKDFITVNRPSLATKI